MRLLLLSICAVLVVVGCGGESATVPSALANDLAGRLEAVAGQLEAGDGCGAIDEIEALQADVSSLRDQELPAPVADELLAALDDLRGQVTCAPPAPPADDEPEDDEDEKEEEEKKEDEKDEHGGEEGGGRGNGTKGRDN